MLDTMTRSGRVGQQLLTAQVLLMVTLLSASCTTAQLAKKFISAGKEATRSIEPEVPAPVTGNVGTAILCGKYGDWGGWSRCNPRCEQTRVRVCVEPEECGSTAITEKRTCNRSKGRECKTLSYKVIGRDKSNRMIEDVLYDLLYAPWSGWGPCLRSCRQRRRRECVYKVICSHSYIQEERRCQSPSMTCNHRFSLQPTAPFFGKPNKTRSVPPTSVQPTSSELGSNLPSTAPNVDNMSGLGNRNRGHSKPQFQNTDHSSEKERENPDSGVDYPSSGNTRDVDFGGHSNRADKSVSSVYNSSSGVTDQEQLMITIMSRRTEGGIQSWVTNNKSSRDNQSTQTSTRYKKGRDRRRRRKRRKKARQGRSRKSRKGSVKRDKCGIRSLQGSYRVIGGQEARPYSWPWQVAIVTLRGKEHYCGGTLIAPRWVLTAAHCVQKNNRTRKFLVRVGSHDLQLDGSHTHDIRPEKEFPHPKFDYPTISNDIALVKLQVNVPGYNYPNYACLPQRSFRPKHLCYVVGWGKTDSDHVVGSDYLREAQIPVVGRGRCQNALGYPIAQGQVCAGYWDGRIDSCAGDSGGPLLCATNPGARTLRYAIFGVTSFGEGCGEKGKYGIYTRVGHYLGWIRKTMRENSKDNKKEARV